MSTNISDGQMSWHRNESTREACSAYEKRQLELCRQLFGVCQKSSDPNVRDAITRVLETESFIRFMGGKSELKNIIGGSTKPNGI